MFQHEGDIDETENVFDKFQEVAALERFLVVNDFEDVDGCPSKLTIYGHHLTGTDY